MRTRILPASPEHIDEAARVLREGGLVAFPTETVYGLGARADRQDAVLRIFEAKDRPPTNPLIVHVPSAERALALTEGLSKGARDLAAAVWPGPLTLVCPRRPGVIVDEVAAFGLSVGLRVPAHPVAHALLEAAGVPVAAPSANRSTTISPTTAEHVRKTLDGRVDVILDGGSTAFGIESTVVDVTGWPWILLRHGAVPLARIADFGTVVDRGSEVVTPSTRAMSPGQHSRHYAPNARLVIVPEALFDAAITSARALGTVGALCIDIPLDPSIFTISLPPDPEGYGRELYAALHAMDDAGVATIVAVDVPNDPAWAAVRDRLRRASAPEPNRA